MSEVKQVKFSSNGAYIMLGTSENSIVLIDAYEGKLVSLSISIIYPSDIVW